MASGSVNFHRDIGYDFYLVREGEKGECKITPVPMPRAGTHHSQLSDEVVIGIPRGEDDPLTLRGKIIDAYRNLAYGRKKGSV